jgi:hypothetical protein
VKGASAVKHDSDEGRWLFAVSEEWSPQVSLAGVPQPLARGVEELIAGNVGTAGRLFAEQLESSDGKIAALALSLAWLAETRCFNMLPGGAGTGAIDVRVRWNGIERAKANHELAKTIRGRTDASAASTASRWLQFVAGVSSSAASLRDTREQAAMRAILLPSFIASAEGSRYEAEQITPEAVGFVDRVLMQLCRQAGDIDAARARLEEARSRAADRGDDFGVLACRVLAADLNASRHTSILIGDFELDEASGPSSEQRWSIEAIEGSGGHLDQAHRDELDELLAAADASGAQRLAASVVLRQAVVLRAHGDPVDAVALAREAARRCDAIGDVMHGHLARTHAMIASLHARDRTDDRELARSIGQWGRTEGSFTYALGLGLMLTRAGRRALMHDGDYERAQSAFELAQVLDEALGAQLRVAQCELERR